MRNGRTAAFTVTRDEPLFLRVWCNYYGSVFPHEDLYVVDNSTTDSSVEEAKRLFPRINFVERPSPWVHDSMFLKGVVERQVSELLRTHEVVVFAETDEYLIPSARYAGLADYCQQFAASGKPYVRATGWNVVQQVDSEPMIERVAGAQLLARRDSMWRIPIYDKTLITRVPMVYQKGFHNFYVDGVKRVDEPLDEELALLHAWRVDVDEYCRRHLGRTRSTREDVLDYFRTHNVNYAGSSGDPHAVGEETRVPEHWRPLLTL